MTGEPSQQELLYKHVKQISVGANSGVADPVLYLYSLSPSRPINDVRISMKLCIRLGVFENMMVI